MQNRYPPISSKCPHFMHGGDYNPDQWPEEVWTEDMRLMKLAGCNAMSIGIFSWAQLEPSEGEYTFGWLDRIMDMLAENNAFAVLATPSAAQPAWMSQKYPEVLRVHENLAAPMHGFRVNYCLTSPIYREKCREMARRLAERYRDHDALAVWHMSNEYGNYCYCSLCRDKFREWLKKKYTTLETLNEAWWTAFWSHTFHDWSEIEGPGYWDPDFGAHGEINIQALHLDWFRFQTENTVDFMRNEMAPIREITPEIQITTNLMGTYVYLDPWKQASDLDVVSWDSYPMYHAVRGDIVEQAAGCSFTHDINRCLKGGKPFMLMESTPSATNWMAVQKLKKPGMHRLMSLQAVAHGADTVQYFQWRKGRGGGEKFHGAVVDHVGHENTRVFQDVAEVGEILAKLDPVIGATVRPEVAIIYDWENRWAIDRNKCPVHARMDYEPICKAHYLPFWQRGIPVDVINMDQDFSKYRLLVAPMLYMVREGVGKQIEKFVRSGGTFVATYMSGTSDATDLAFTNGRPGPLRKTLGIWAEEWDGLYEGEFRKIIPEEESRLGLSGEYLARDICDLIHAEGAEVLATYGDDFYAGTPALTVNRFGEGEAFYVASRNDKRFLDDLYQGLAVDLDLNRVLPVDLPDGVTAQKRMADGEEFVFLLNFTEQKQEIQLGETEFRDLTDDTETSGAIEIEPYDSLVLQRKTD